MVEEAVGLARVGDELAFGAEGDGFVAVGFDGVDGDGGIGFAVEDDGGRGSALEVVEGGEVVGGDAHAFCRDTGGEDEGGVEEDEGVGAGASLFDFAGFFEAGDGGGGGGEVAPGGTSTGGEAVRVNAEALRVEADVAEGGFGVAEAGIDFDLVTGGDAVVGGDGDHAAGGEELGLVFELGGGAVGPAAAEEEDDGGAGVGGGVARGVVDPEAEFDVSDGLVDLFVGAGEDGRVLRLGEGRESEGGEKEGEAHGEIMSQDELW